jgi:hypothetical protein
MTMQRINGRALGIALACAGFVLAGCGDSGDAQQAETDVAAQTAQTGTASQTTAATLPVVTVYKSPT